MHNKLEYYIPLVVMALVVILLAHANPLWIQQKKNGISTGQPCYIRVALVSLLVGAGVHYLICTQMQKTGGNLWSRV